MNSLQILVADDHDLMRRGLRSVLEAQPAWQVCAEARTGVEAVEMAEKHKPDVAILDISMPGLNGLEAAKQIRKASQKTEILMLSMHYNDQLIRDVVDAGVRGYLIKSDSDRDLVVAVKALADHKPFFTPHATELMLSSMGEPRMTIPESSSEIRERLTPREHQIVQLISEGKNSKEAAAQLGISVKTAETHRANIMRKLQVHTVSELVRYALRNKIIEP
ncbi:MAG TPA: response regulator transcription factor [Candidatus Limnocylindrales bacterium]|nr:response regulator transcription factor [Candidatus Limnocylindrales bacterium]